MNAAAKIETTSSLFAVLLETRVRGVVPKNTTAIGLESPVSSTLRWDSWQVYDRTAIGRLVGLDYFGARYMSSAQGRFTSPDLPLIDQKATEPQSWNLYAYGRNNPLRFIDPTGHCSAPSVEEGQVGICIDNYIQAKKLPTPPLTPAIAYGDNRGPAPSDSSATYRQEIQLVVTPGASVSMVKNDAGVSEAMTALPGPVGWNPVKASLKGTSQTTVSGLTVGEDGNSSFTVNSIGVNGLSSLPFAPKDQIQTTVTFTITPDGKVGLAGGMRTAYPSIEIYSYDAGGASKTIYQRTESGNLNDLKRKNQPIPVVRPR